jgi:homoaconitate hydratase
MGSRDARCYLASPEVVAASAVAGYIRGPESLAGRKLETDISTLEPPGVADEGVDILAGFPEHVRGRLIFTPQDNLNTDGIYGKDYTYRDDMTPEMMAEVVMENYDPNFAPIARDGDVLVGGWNFGTGSSREQAVTSLQAKGIVMVLAGSFSQTYLRNAFNNGFPCIECPDLVTHLREELGKKIEAGLKTIAPGDDLEIDFRSGKVTFRGRSFRFPPLGAVPQSLVVAGGVENQVRARLGLG